MCNRLYREYDKSNGVHFEVRRWKRPLEYYLALLNSRVVYYYYLKTYGENEWKSHPYLTKQIIYTFPIRPFNGDQIDTEIIALASKLMRKYDYSTDIKLERLIMKKYRNNP